MLPFVVAASVLAAVLSGQSDDEDEEDRRRRLDLGGPDPDGEVNPDELTLLQVLEVTSAESLYVVSIGEGYVSGASASRRSAISDAENDNESDETVVTQYDRLPVGLYRRVLEHFEERGGHFSDGYDAGHALERAVSRGATSEEIFHHSMDDDPFDEWPSHRQKDFRRERIYELSTGEISVGTLLYTTTSQPELWEPWVGEEVDEDVADEGIAAVTTRQEVSVFHLDVSSVVDPTHVVTLKVLEAIPDKAMSRGAEGRVLLIPLGKEGDDWRSSTMSEIMDGTGFDVRSRQDIDTEEILERLNQYNDGGGIILEYDGGALVVLPWRDTHRLRVVSVEPLEPEG